MLYYLCEFELQQSLLSATIRDVFVVEYKLFNI